MESGKNLVGEDPSCLKALENFCALTERHGYGNAAKQAEKRLIQEMEQLCRDHAQSKARRDESKHAYW